MPDIDDITKGDYLTEDAVIKPREPQLTYFNMDPDKHCAMCHDGKAVPFPKDKKPRLITMHQDIVEDSMELMHGEGAIWCLDCHTATNRNTLIDHRGGRSASTSRKSCVASVMAWNTGIGEWVSTARGSGPGPQARRDGGSALNAITPTQSRLTGSSL